MNQTSVRTWYGFVFLLIGQGLASWPLSHQPSASSPPVPNYRAFRLTPEDIARVLGLNVTKTAVNLPAPGRKLYMEVVEKAPGRVPKRLFPIVEKRKKP